MNGRIAAALALAVLVAAGGSAMALVLGRSPTGAEWAVLGVGMLAVAVSAVAFQPLRERLIRLGGNRSADPRDVLEAAGGRLAQPLPLDDLLTEVAQSLRAVFGLAAAEIWTCDELGLGLKLAACDPYRPPSRVDIAPAEARAMLGARLAGPAWLRVWLPGMLEGRRERSLRAAVIRQPGELLGLIVIELADGQEELTLAQEHALADLTRQVGLTLQNVRRADELRFSRARVVAAGDAERRRIERDLHDGAQQHLVAISVNLRTARDLADTEPDRAAELLGRLGEDIEAAMRQLRDLAHGIYPPLLQQRGLGDALRVASDRTPLTVSVDAGGVGRHSQDVEAAVYFCCVEAMQNVAKHVGEGTKVSIRLEQADGRIEFEVSDDGPGFDRAAVNGGAGLAGMSDRVAALGGRLDVDSGDGRGTRVRGTIPSE